MTLCFLCGLRVPSYASVHGNWSAACYVVDLRGYFDPFHPVLLHLMCHNRLFRAFVNMVPQMPEVLLAFAVTLRSVLVMIAPLIFHRLTTSRLLRVDLVI